MNTLPSHKSQRLFVSQEIARKIMGNNFIGIEEGVRHFANRLFERQIASISEVYFTKETLIAKKETHILVAVLPLSIMDMRKSELNRKLHYLEIDNWYTHDAFANERGKLEWRLIRKTPIPETIGKDWNNQQTYLTHEECVPTSRIMIYSVLVNHLMSNERLLEDMMVRCSDVDSSGEHIAVGNFTYGGLRVDSDNHWCDYRRRSLGIATAQNT